MWIELLGIIYQEPELTVIPGMWIELLGVLRGRYQEGRCNDLRTSGKNCQFRFLIYDSQELYPHTGDECQFRFLIYDFQELYTGDDYQFRFLIYDSQELYPHTGDGRLCLT
ncbi:hypothetical protein NDU88_007933 [Pleurodeles waltl]|uniref:Uncharacterized protein n=1 Tax=Pleurodeles waltl TaxID=8319 RepID=A0AAV7VV75_PLEWA|nr:hypothetical protein NDU88_007933 [Pleurodeles waltl]